MARTTTTPPFFARGVCPWPRHEGFNSLPSAAVVSSSSSSKGRATKRACACSPTTHPGSFRCALHRGCSSSSPGPATTGGLHQDASRRSAVANSLARVAAAEGGGHVRRALAALVRPSSHHQRRRASSFRALPSRLSAMSAAAAAAEPSTPV